MTNQDNISINSQNLVLADSHCHLYFNRFTDLTQNSAEQYTITNIVQRANAASVKYILTIGTTLADIPETFDIIQNHKNVFRTVGIHPLEAHKHYEQYSINDITEIITTNCKSTVGIGEIGLDYYYNKDNIKEQHILFELQLDLAKKHNLPVCIHSRNAENDTISILKNHPGSNGVIHCFTGSSEFAYKALDLGFYISVSGVITFKKSDILRNTITNIPLEKLLIETDAPFLAPTPFRGKTNEPAFVTYTAQQLADILKVPLATIVTQTTKNFSAVFRIPIS